MPGAPTGCSPRVGGGSGCWFGVCRDSGIKHYAVFVADGPGIVSRLQEEHVAGPEGHLGPVIGPNSHLLRHADAGMSWHTRIGARDRLHILGPLPTRFKGPLAQSEIPERDDVNVTMCLERTGFVGSFNASLIPVSYTHLRAHETDSYLVCR